MAEVIIETILHSLKTLPFLLGAYWLIEYLEQHNKASFKMLSRFGALGGSLLGCIPQCGFSAAASQLYARRFIPIGTLIAIFLATSDEALPILFAHPEHLGTLLAIIGGKIIIGVIFGSIINLIFKSETLPYEACDTTNKNECPGNLKIFICALKRTMFIFIFLAAVMFILNTIVYFIGEDAIATVLISGNPFQAFITSLFGLIPNCAPSVILTELYISGDIGFGSLLGGLCTGSGAGLLMLYRENKNIKQNLLITALVYLIGAFVGVMLNFII